MKDAADNFIKFHKRQDKGGCAWWDSNPKESGSEFRDYKSCRLYSNDDSLSEEQIWRVLRTADLNWISLRCLIIRQSECFDKEFDPDNPPDQEGLRALERNRFSAEQVDYAFKVAGDDWRVLKCLIYLQEPSDRHLEYVIDLIDRRWEWIEAVPGIEHFSKKNIDKLVGKVDIRSEHELNLFISRSNIDRLKLSKRAFEALSKAFSDGDYIQDYIAFYGVGDFADFKRVSTGASADPFDHSGNPLPIAIECLISSHSSHLLNLLLSRQKLSADEINKLRGVFADTPSIFEAILRHWARLTPSHVSRIARSVARKWAILDYLADSNEAYYADQVDFILSHRVDRNRRRLNESSARPLPCSCFK